MNYYKKAAAFLMGIVLCSGYAVLPVTAGYADDEESGSSYSEENVKEENGFSYTVDSDGNAVIVECSLTDKEIDVPSVLGGATVTEISTEAFLESGIEKINIPASVTYISTDNPFASCLALKEINVDSANENYCSVDGILFSKDKKKLLHYPASIESDSYTVPDGVEEIGVAALAEGRLKNITLPSSLKTIDRHAFSFDAWLESVDMSNTAVKLIDVMAFAKCTALKEVKFSDKTTEFGTAAFIGCSSLAEVTLPEKLEIIGQSAFMGTALKQVRIPDSVTYIGYSAFGYDEEEKADSSFTIIAKQGSVGYTYCKDKDTEYGYENNFQFKSVETAEEEEEYGKLDTKSDGDYEYYLEGDDAVITICVSMDSKITVPGEFDGHKVTSIRKGAFSGLEASEIILPDSVKTIGENIFPATVTKITLSGNLESFGNEEPFLACSALKEISVGSGEGAFTAKDGVLYSKDMKQLVAYPMAKDDDSFSVPADVTEIDLSAFCGNPHLKKIDISHVEAIGNYAFQGCTSLESVEFSKNLDSVGEGAFLDCTSLKSVRLYDKLQYIGDYSIGFYYDENIRNQVDQGFIKDADPYTVTKGFTIYTTEDSMAYKYGKTYNMNVVTDTVAVAGNNVKKGFIYAVAGIIGAIVLAIAGIFTGKTISRKKADKKREATKKQVAEKLAEKNKDTVSGEEKNEDTEA